MLHKEYPPLPVGAAIVPSEIGYAADRDGNIYSCWNNRWGIGDKWVKLNPPIGHRGYRHLLIRQYDDNGNRLKAKLRYVHHLVLEAFIGPRPEGMECLHGSGDDGTNDKTDCRLSNLKWGTPKQNAGDRDRHGSIKRGESSHLTKITDAFLLEIMTAIVDGAPANVPTAKMFAKKLGVSWRGIWEYIKPKPRYHRNGISIASIKCRKDSGQTA